MRYLVTGGAGFVGSHLTDRLLADGHSVIVIDNLSSGCLENLSQNKGNQKFQFIRADINTDIEKLLGGKKIDGLFHLAALPQVQRSIDNPKKSHRINVDGTHNLLVYCKKHDVRFVFTSSCSVYGDQQELPLTETHIPHPVSPYALGKFIGEQYCRLYSWLYNMETVCLRPFNIYGPRQSSSGGYANMIPKFISLVLAGKPPTVNGTGENTRDYIYISDVVDANIAAMAKKNVRDGEVINIGVGEHRSVNEVANRLIKLSGKNIQPTHLAPVIEPKNALADISLAKRLLNWAPKVTFEEGLRSTYEYFLHNG